jgi:nucleoside-diphosphate-sugar epimerase
MTTLACGGAGVVGSHLCERLLALGETVVCLDDLSTGRMVDIASVTRHPGFTFVQHVVVEPLPPLPRIERISRLASPASPSAYRIQPVGILRANGEGTLRLLELAARDDGARRGSCSPRRQTRTVTPCSSHGTKGTNRPVRARCTTRARASARP